MAKAFLFLWIVFDRSGLLIPGILVGESPHNFSMPRIERMDQAFGYAQGDPGNTAGVVDVPKGYFGVLIVERNVFDAIGLKAGNGILEE